MDFKELFELEKLVITGLINKPELIYSIADDFNANCFKSDSCRNLFKHITDFIYNPHDDNLFVYLSQKAPEYRNVWLTMASDVQPDFVVIGASKELINNRNKQVFITLSKEIENTVNNPDFDVNNLDTLIFKTLIEYKDTKKKTINKISDFSDDYLKSIYDPNNSDYRVKTGFDDLDRKLHLTNGDLHIIAARPSMGKTSLACQIAKHICISQPTLIFSLEMSKEALLSRYLSGETDIPTWKIRDKQLNDYEKNVIAEKIKIFNAMELYIDDTPGKNIMAIMRESRKAKIEKNIGCIMVDYLQMVHGSNDKREREISEISSSFKNIARELNIPFIALCQLNRLVEIEKDKRPKLAHLRESGSLEQDADSVTMIFREDQYRSKDEEKDNIAELIIRKQRNGATGTVLLTWDGETTSFKNYVKRDTWSPPPDKKWIDPPAKTNYNSGNLFD